MALKIPNENIIYPMALKIPRRTNKAFYYLEC
jgi:hypothetical protein